MHAGTRLLAAAVLLLLSAVPACRGVRADAALQRGSVLVLGAAGNDHEATIRGAEGRLLLFLALLEEAEDGAMTGALARSWTQSPDGMEWTFHLRSDVRWHDGVPVTAADVVFTFELHADPVVAEAPPGRFTAVRAVDDSTVVVRTAEPWTAEHWSWDIALPRHLLQELDRSRYQGWGFWKAPVGNGPFRFVRALRNTMIELEASEDHYAGRPAVDRVILKLVGGAGLAELLAGNVDVLPFVSAADALRIARDDRFRLYHWFNDLTAQVVYWRIDHPFFADPAVRQALTLGIDRHALLRVLSLPEDTPVPDALYTRQQFRRGELPAPLPYDTAEAGRLLRNAGWRDTDGDGVLDRDGRPFRFTLLLPGELYGGLQAAIFVKDQLRRLGITADLHPVPRAQGIQQMRSGDFEAALAWIGLDDQLSRFIGKDGWLRGADPRLVELAERAAATSDPVERDLLFSEMTEIYRTDSPVTPLFPHPMMAAAHRRVGGIRTPYRVDGGGSLHITELWLDTGAVVEKEH
jgi:peptide/nickel transport system substrate-binding protein